MKIELGSEVQDTVTGFKGIVIGRTEYLNGCARCGVQPKVGKDGRIIETVWFDEPQLKVLRVGKVARGPIDTGGPCPSTPTQKIPG